MFETIFVNPLYPALAPESPPAYKVLHSTKLVRAAMPPDKLLNVRELPVAAVNARLIGTD